MVTNDADKESCPCCEAPKPGSTAKKAPSSAFDNPGKANAAFAVTPGGGGFKFGAAASTTSPAAAGGGAGGGGFIFGGGGGTASTGYVTADCLEISYRVTQKVLDLGWVDLDMT